MAERSGRASQQCVYCGVGSGEGEGVKVRVGSWGVGDGALWWGSGSGGGMRREVGGEGEGREMVSHNTALVSAGGITVAGPVLRMNIISFEGVGSDILCLGRESSSTCERKGCYEYLIIVIIIIVLL